MTEEDAHSLTEMFDNINNVDIASIVVLNTPNVNEAIKLISTEDLKDEVTESGVLDKV